MINNEMINNTHHVRMSTKTKTEKKRRKERRMNLNHVEIKNKRRPDKTRQEYATVCQEPLAKSSLPTLHYINLITIHHLFSVFTLM